MGVASDRVRRHKPVPGRERGLWRAEPGRRSKSRREQRKVAAAKRTRRVRAEQQGGCRAVSGVEPGARLLVDPPELRVAH